MPVVVPLYWLEFLLQSVPLWIFLVPLMGVAAVGLRFRRRPVLRRTCLAMAGLIVLAAIPPVAVRVYHGTGGEAALRRRFGQVSQAGCVAKYRFVIAGLGDTREFWKLRRVDAGACEKIISDHNLVRLPEDRISYPGSMTAAPWWWPNSTTGYRVFAGDDGYMGSIEVWVPQKGASVFLYRFIE
jgi:hypothetical protein